MDVKWLSATSLYTMRSHGGGDAGLTGLCTVLPASLPPWQSRQKLTQPLCPAALPPPEASAHLDRRATRAGLRRRGRKAAGRYKHNPTGGSPRMGARWPRGQSGVVVGVRGGRSEALLLAGLPATQKGEATDGTGKPQGKARA